MVTPILADDVLSPQEKKILALAGGGATDREIADDLGVSVAALRAVWMKIRDKLGASNRTHAIALAGGERPASPADLRSHLVEGLVRDRVATWVCQTRSRRALLDPLAERFYGLCPAPEGVPLDRLLAHVWSPDRARFARFLSQAADLRPMTPIETRVGEPGDYRLLLRTVNLAHQASSETTLLLASTVIHTFAP